MQWRKIYLSYEIIWWCWLYIVWIRSPQTSRHILVSCKLKPILAKRKSKEQTNPIKTKLINNRKGIKDRKITNNRFLVDKDEKITLSWIYS